MTTTIHPSPRTVPDRLIVPTCAGCGAMIRPGTCESGCLEQRLDLVPADTYDELIDVRREAHACIDTFRAVVEDFVHREPLDGQYESAYRSVQHQARTVLHRFPDPLLKDQALRGPTAPAAIGWCTECGGIDAPQQCLEFCIWRSVEWVTYPCYQHERMLAVSEWLVESHLRTLLRRIASVTPLDGEWSHSWRALQAEARGMLDSPDAAPSIAVHEDGGARGAVATSSPATTADGLNATIGDHDAEEFQRGRLEGMDWARSYATADELRNLVENVESGRGGDRALDNLHWRGFLDGAEEVLDAELAG